MAAQETNRSWAAGGGGRACEPGADMRPIRDARLRDLETARQRLMAAPLDQPSEAPIGEAEAPTAKE